MEQDELKHALEALLFASDRPLAEEEIQAAFPEANLTKPQILEWVEKLKSEYEAERRGFQLCRVGGGFQMLTHPRFADSLRKFYQAREKHRLSQAGLETLSVVAYKQPVTKAQIEWIRGVNVDGALKTLLERDLVRWLGRKQAPGRPILYGTTRRFLEHFGLNSLEELPPLGQFTPEDLDPRWLSLSEQTPVKRINHER